MKMPLKNHMAPPPLFCISAQQPAKTQGNGIDFHQVLEMTHAND